MEVTFQTTQVLNFDFSHDTNIAAVLTALGLTEFAESIPSDKPASEKRTFIVSHKEPFACVLDIRLIEAPKTLKSGRDTQSRDANAYEDTSGKTQYQGVQ